MTERELLARHLREILEVVEDPESDLSQLRPWLRYWWWSVPTGEEVSARLSRIERKLSSIENKRCAFGEGDEANNVMYLITGLANRRNEERRHITSWLAGSGRLTVVDPYFFSFSGPNKVFRTQSQYVEWLLDFIPKQTERLEVFHLPGPNRRIYSSVAAHCHKKHIELKTWETTEIHDRVLIKNDEEAKAVGTSFGGFGNKIAFVLDVPSEDLEVFRRELHRIRTQI
tara:strand:- start:209 stop:892 length:684 start_codon:yes stop_codon:yes gene_type:complete